MRLEPVITRVEFHPAANDFIETGLLGWVQFDLDGHVRIDGVTVRRTRDGRLTLSFPAPRQRALVAPLNDQTRGSIERQVFDALSHLGVTP